MKRGSSHLLWGHRFVKVSIGTSLFVEVDYNNKDFWPKVYIFSKTLLHWPWPLYWYSIPCSKSISKIKLLQLNFWIFGQIFVLTTHHTWNSILKMTLVSIIFIHLYCMTLCRLYCTSYMKTCTKMPQLSIILTLVNQITNVIHWELSLGPQSYSSSPTSTHLLHTHMEDPSTLKTVICRDFL